MGAFSIETLTLEDFSEVADLIYLSTNVWYQTSGKPRIFSGDPQAVSLFCEVYEALDPGCCYVAKHSTTGRIIGSCFFHPREKHVSLGIMNVHPNYFGLGVARELLKSITDFADGLSLPVRLVSSAMNLDSYSLYTRAGFVPRATYQDMHIPVETVIDLESPVHNDLLIRSANEEDLSQIIALETKVSGISRVKDYMYFLSNPEQGWHISVCEQGGEITGYLCSITHPASNMLGPGIMTNEDMAYHLIIHELKRDLERTPVFLVPAESQNLITRLYEAGAKNCELHFGQVRGAYQAPNGIVMPTFMPETG